MKRFFDFPETLWQYFTSVDKRCSLLSDTVVTPAKIDSYCNLTHIRAVLWDIYGTLCGVDIGDLENIAQNNNIRLLHAARVTIEEFKLTEPLTNLFPSCDPAQALRELYLDMIASWHLASLAQGVEYPEVVIEQIWQDILQKCCQKGYNPPWQEPLRHTAYRCGYFFDSSLQHTWLYPDVLKCLKSLKKAGIVQGIISNAQFYTPVHLRRLFNQYQNTIENNTAENTEKTVELQDIFSEPLVLFSYELGYSKPNKRAFQKARNLLNNQGIKSDEILYIGNDMLNDIWAAQSNNIRTMLYAGDSTQTRIRKDDPRCHNLKPDAIATNMQQVQSFITGK